MDREPVFERDRGRLAIGCGAVEIFGDLGGEHRRVAPFRNRGRALRAAEPRQQSACSLARSTGSRPKNRDDERLDLDADGVQLVQTFGQLVSVLRREQERGEDKVGLTAPERRERLRRRLGDEKLRAERALGERRESRGLSAVRFDRQDEGH